MTIMVNSGSFTGPVHRYLTIITRSSSLLIRAILSVAWLSRGKNQYHVSRRMWIPSIRYSNGSSSQLILLVFVNRDYPRNFHRVLTFKIFVLIMRGGVNLISLIPTIRVRRSDSFMNMFVLLRRNICLIASLFRTASLIGEGETARADFPFAILRMFNVPCPIFNVLGSGISFNSFYRRITYRARCSIMNVFIFIRLSFTGPSSYSEVETSISTSRVRANSF